MQCICIFSDILNTISINYGGKRTKTFVSCIPKNMNPQWEKSANWKKNFSQPSATSMSGQKKWGSANSQDCDVSMLHSDYSVFYFLFGVFTLLSTLYRSYHFFIYLGFYVAFNTVQVISRRVVGRAEETSTYSSLGFCTVNSRPMASNYQLSHMRPCRESNPGLRGGRRECYHSATVAPKLNHPVCSAYVKTLKIMLVIIL